MEHGQRFVRSDTNSLTGHGVQLGSTLSKLRTLPGPDRNTDRDPDRSPYRNSVRNPNRNPDQDADRIPRIETGRLLSNCVSTCWPVLLCLSLLLYCVLIDQFLVQFRSKLRYTNIQFLYVYLRTQLLDSQYNLLSTSGSSIVTQSNFHIRIDIGSTKTPLWRR